MTKSLEKHIVIVSLKQMPLTHIELNLIWFWMKSSQMPVPVPILSQSTAHYSVHTLLFSFQIALSAAHTTHTLTHTCSGPASAPIRAAPQKASVTNRRVFYSRPQTLNWLNRPGLTLNWANAKSVKCRSVLLTLKIIWNSFMICSSLFKHIMVKRINVINWDQTNTTGSLLIIPYVYSVLLHKVKNWKTKNKLLISFICWQIPWLSYVPFWWNPFGKWAVTTLFRLIQRQSAALFST